MVTLTERELHLERTSDRDSALKLRLETVTNQSSWLGENQPLSWRTPAKLATLGFRCGEPTDGSKMTTQSCRLARRAFVAFEYNGPAWQRVVEALHGRRAASLQAANTPAPDATAAAERLERQIKYGSRLVAVDASADPGALRRAYPNRQRYLILPAVMRAWVSVDRRTNLSAGPVANATFELLASMLIAPAEFGDRLRKEDASGWGSLQREPRFAVTLAVGRRYEPWIVSIEPFDTPSTPH